MTLAIVAIVGWLLAAVFSWPWWQLLLDWVSDWWERRHRPTWPPQDEANG